MGLKGQELKVQLLGAKKAHLHAPAVRPIFVALPPPACQRGLLLQAQEVPLRHARRPAAVGSVRRGRAPEGGVCAREGQRGLLLAPPTERSLPRPW